jgi:hypothetical protein
MLVRRAVWKRIQCRLMSRKKAGHKHNTRIAKRFFEGVAKFRYLGTTLTDQNIMNKEIKS